MSYVNKLAIFWSRTVRSAGRARALDERWMRPLSVSGEKTVTAKHLHLS